METSYESLLANLARNRVDFILVGGLAVDLSGFSRSTRDVDILVEDSEENIERLLAALAQFGQGSATELTVADFTREEGSIRVLEDFPLDIFTVMNERLYSDLLEHSRTHMIGELEIRYLGPSGLILLKQGSLRPKDQLDVEMLKRLEG